MKKLSVILAIGALVGAIILPQAAVADVRFGIKGGGNMANVNGSFASDLGDWKNTIGFCAGIFVELNLGNVLTIQPEVLYTLKGAKAEGVVVDVPASEKLSFDYIEIPLLLKLRVPAGSIHPFIFAGPAIGFNLSSKLEYALGDEEGAEPIENFKKVDYSAIFGAGLQLGGSLHFDVRYTMGLQKLIQVPDLEAFDLKNGVLSATIGLAF